MSYALNWHGNLSFSRPNLEHWLEFWCKNSLKFLPTTLVTENFTYGRPTRFGGLSYIRSSWKCSQSWANTRSNAANIFVSLTGKCKSQLVADHESPSVATWVEVLSRVLYELDFAKLEELEVGSVLGLGGRLHGGAESAGEKFRIRRQFVLILTDSYPMDELFILF